MNKKELLKACEELIDRKLQMKEERKVVIHTKTKEQLIKVLEIFEKKGWKWWNGDLPTENINVWESFNVTKNTYIGYEDNFGYSNNYEIYKYLCYKIISFEEFLKREGLEEKPKPKAGDFIEIEGCPCLLVNKGKWKNPFCKGDLAVVILKLPDGDNWMELANDYQEWFEKGDYKPLTKEEGLRRLAK
jgi:hypothetical protein